MLQRLIESPRGTWSRIVNVHPFKCLHVVAYDAPQTQVPGVIQF